MMTIVLLPNKPYMTPTQIENAKKLNDALLSVNLTNKYLRAGILAVVMKESGLIPKTEFGYSTTSTARIRKIFPSRVSKLTDSEIEAIKKDDRKFFNLVYNGRIGNAKEGDDGYNYRGRGFNQLTGKANYLAIGEKIGVDLVSNPQLLADIDVASKACAIFFRENIVTAQASGKFKQRHGITKTAEIDSLHKGCLVAHDCNGGFNIWPENDPTGGYAMTEAYSVALLGLIQNNFN